ncbi:MAG TPA: nucleoside hydrolase [Pelolinea sp.]|nr:nucleoside hydrolase [Pelolinea sp.]
MARNVIIDYETGLDDAVALLLALRSPELNVLGITCVNDNVNLDRVIINTLKVVDHSGKKIPVFAGATSSMIPDYSEDASKVHGSDGLVALGLVSSISMFISFILTYVFFGTHRKNKSASNLIP